MFLLHIYKLDMPTFLSFYHLILPFSFRSIVEHIVLKFLCAVPCICVCFLNIYYTAYIHFCSSLTVELKDFTFRTLLFVSHYTSTILRGYVFKGVLGWITS